jgi:hypothetical protein
MAGGPGLLPVSFPASQAPGQGWATPCNHCFPATLWLGWAGPLGQADRRHAALLWPEYPAGQGSVPRPPGASLDSSPIPGGLEKQALASPSPGMHLPGPLLRLHKTHPRAPLDILAFPACRAPHLLPSRLVGEDQTLDPRTAPASRPFPGLAMGSSGETFRDKGGTFQTSS